MSQRPQWHDRIQPRLQGKTRGRGETNESTPHDRARRLHVWGGASTTGRDMIEVRPLLVAMFVEQPHVGLEGGKRTYCKPLS